MVRNGTHHAYPEADHELSDLEIIGQYTTVLSEAARAFEQDPEYIITMVRHAGLHARGAREWWVERERSGLLVPNELADM